MLEGISLLLSVVAVLSIIGLAIYFYIDVDKHKIANVKDFNTVKTDLTSEKNDRLGNLAYVIDQVNVVNKDIKKTYDTAVSDLSVKSTNLGTRIEGVESGFGSLLSIRNGTSNIPLSSLASVANPNIDLIKNVSVMGGMTIKDVQSKPFKICSGTGVTEKCLQFPNADGDMYFTGIGTSGGIVMDAPTTMSQDIQFSKNALYNGDVTIQNTYGSIQIPKINPYQQVGLKQTIMFKDNQNVEMGGLASGETSGGTFITLRGNTDLLMESGRDTMIEADTIRLNGNILLNGDVDVMVNGSKVRINFAQLLQNQSNGSATNGSATNGSATNGSATNGSATNGSATNGSTTNGSATNGSATTGSATTGSATTGSATTGSATTGSATTGSATTGSATNGSDVQGNPETMSGCPYSNDTNYYCADGSSSSGKYFKIVNGQRQEYENYTTTVGDDSLRKTLNDCTSLNELCPLIPTLIPA